MIVKEFVSIFKNLDIDSRVILMSDIAGMKHGYNMKESLSAYRGLKSVCESWDFDDISQFKRDIFTFCEENLFNLRFELGADAMLVVEDDAKDKQKEKDKEEKARKNKEEFDKKREQQKKSEQSPLKKAIVSKGEDQDDAAEVLDVDKSTISRIKTGTRKPSFDLMKQMKKHYGAGVVNQLLEK
jgi:DNA-binding XRE family transcriptional regulator